MAEVTLYGSDHCPYCVRAELLLRSRGCHTINKIMVDRDPQPLAEMMARTGRRTVPQIFIGPRHIGGYDDLSRIPGSELDMLLAAPPAP
ncbi:glutaredoxin 3 [Denitromonas iodatirespirans]|uniref:Glutaredoxin n=1 Tax=Denitromonas iodatirespirans TaxID=2795389 RepID=A0A944DQ18_DENI1|nr:glutaredoxin 3 [Denitromonas iodatirespirans]MBT0962539.1 glutaredoxin 3 [Denitromonas iodatirespirans]